MSRKALGFDIKEHVYHLESDRREEPHESDYYYMRNIRPTAIGFEEEQLAAIAKEVMTTGVLPLVPFLLITWVLAGQLRLYNIVSSAVCWLIAIGIAVLFLVPIVRRIKSEESERLRLLLGKKKPGTKIASVTTSAEDNLTWKRRTFLYYWLGVTIVVNILGMVFGDYLYKHYTYPYHQYLSLKWVKSSINPLLQEGANFQDAGVVSFSPDSYIGLSHSGCYRALNENFCVAPMLQDLDGSGVKSKLPQAPTGTYDYFAVGKDCCSCPESGDFQCGDWAYNDGQGGLRQLDLKDRAQYELAVDQWAATYGVVSKTPLFFEWTNHPAKKIKHYKESRWNTVWITLLMLFFLLVLVALATHFGRFAYFEYYSEKWIRDREVKERAEKRKEYEARHANIDAEA